MSVESVSQVENDLALTQADIEILKGVRLVWQKIQQLRGKALKDEKSVSSYRELLARSLTQARAQQAPMSDEDIQEASRVFWNWYSTHCAELGIAELEERRGMPHMAWAEKWLRAEYAAFDVAIAKIVDSPSPLHFNQAKASATSLLKAYAGYLHGG